MDKRNIGIFDMYCAAFLMAWGCRLLATETDERGYLIFIFDTVQAQQAMAEWNNPQTVVVASSFVQSLKYLRRLVRGEAA